MYQGFEPFVPVNGEPLTEQERVRVRENVRVLKEITAACYRGDAELVKRLAELIELA